MVTQRSALNTVPDTNESVQNMAHRIRHRWIHAEHDTPYPTTANHGREWYTIPGTGELVQNMETPYLTPAVSILRHQQWPYYYDTKEQVQYNLHHIGQRWIKFEVSTPSHHWPNTCSWNESMNHTGLNIRQYNTLIKSSSLSHTRDQTTGFISQGVSSPCVNFRIYH